MGSRVLLNFFVIVALVFIASANGASVYKLLEYNEEFPQPRLNVVQRTWTPRIQEKQDTDYYYGDPNLARSYRNFGEFDSSTDAPEIMRESSFEETNDINNFLKDSGVPYSRIPMPAVVIATQDNN